MSEQDTSPNVEFNDPNAEGPSVEGVKEGIDVAHDVIDEGVPLEEPLKVPLGQKEEKKQEEKTPEVGLEHVLEMMKGMQAEIRDLREGKTQSAKEDSEMSPEDIQKEWEAIDWDTKDNSEMIEIMGGMCQKLIESQVQSIYEQVGTAMAEVQYQMLQMAHPDAKLFEQDMYKLSQDSPGLSITELYERAKRLRGCDPAKVYEKGRDGRLRVKATTAERSFHRGGSPPGGIPQTSKSGAFDGTLSPRQAALVTMRELERS